MWSLVLNFFASFLSKILSDYRRDKKLESLGWERHANETYRIREDKRREADNEWDMLDRDHDHGDLRGDL